MNQKKKIAIIAYACEPFKTSEPGVGWNFSKALENDYSIIVLTRTNNKESIELLPADQRTFIYYDLPQIFKWIKKKMPLGTQLYYALWQWGAYMYLKKYIDNTTNDIDAIHHLTFGVSWITPPSFLLNKKFIWGPIGGGDVIPLKFLHEKSLKAIFQESLYALLNQSNKLFPFYYWVRRNADAIIFRTYSAQQKFTQAKTNMLPIISETAAADLSQKPQKEYSQTLYAVCVGRMTYWKSFIYAVEGFHSFLKNGGQGKLELLGNGPEFDLIQKYIQSNGLEKSIILKGAVPHSEVQTTLEHATVLLHPSFRDGGSWSIMEAMSYGLPVICLNTSGPKDMVTDQCGFLIDLNSHQQIIEDIGKSLMKLSKDETRFRQLSDNAQSRIHNEYNWEKRGTQMSEVYESVFQSKSDSTNR